jgi:hypothetical protein
MLAVIVLIAVGIRLIFWLLCPVWPYVVGAVMAFTLFRLVRWYRGRW